MYGILYGNRVYIQEVKTKFREHISFSSPKSVIIFDSSAKSLLAALLLLAAFQRNFILDSQKPVINYYHYFFFTVKDLIYIFTEKIRYIKS